MTVIGHGGDGREASIGDEAGRASCSKLDVDMSTSSGSLNALIPGHQTGFNTSKVGVVGHALGGNTMAALLGSNDTSGACAGALTHSSQNG